MRLKDQIIQQQENPSLIETIREYQTALDSDSFKDIVRLHNKIQEYIEEQQYWQD